MMGRRSERVRNAIVLAVACVAAGMIAPYTALGADLAGGFSVRPAHVDPADPASRTYFKPVVAPGASFADQVIVSNSADAPLDLLVAPVDGLTATTSGAVYANRDQPRTKAGAWVTPDVSTVRVPPHAESTIGFSVRVPGDAAPGDHLAGLALEDAKLRSSGQGVSVTQVIRAVVGVLVQVPGPAQFQPAVAALDLAALPGFGTASVVVHLGNSGAKLGKPGLAVSLDGPAGYHRAVNHQLDTILPGDTIPFPLPWPDTLQAGDYDVLVTVTGGAEPVVFRTRVHLGGALPGAPPPTAARRATARHARSSDTSWLWLVATGLGGGLLGAALVRRPRRRSRRRPQQEIPATRPAEPGWAPPHARRNGDDVEPAIKGPQGAEPRNGSQSRSRK